MSTTSREIAQSAPKTGPWIIAYVVSFVALVTAARYEVVTSPATAAPFWIPIIGSVVMIIYTSWKRHRMLGTLSPAIKSFWRRFVAAAGFMFAAYCLLAYAQMGGQWSETTIDAIAYLPIPGFLGMIWAVHQYVRDEDDEYLRSQSVRQLIVASFVTLVGALAWSTLIQAGLTSATDIGQVLLLWFAGLGVGRLVNEIRP